MSIREKANPVALSATVVLVLTASGCGGSVSRYAPGAPGAPAGLTAIPGNGQVTLTWQPASNASVYTVYYAGSAGVTKENGTKLSSISSTSTMVTGLTNDAPYFFVVTSSNSQAESAPSVEVSATPFAPVTFAQSDLTGTWRFAVLSTGTAAGWRRGTISVGAAGDVTFLTDGSSVAYADSLGNSAPPDPASFLPVLLVDASGQVRDASDPSAAVYTGALAATHRKVIVATASSGGTSSIAILLKHDPAIVFQAGSGSGTDISGWGGGGTGGGARKFVYDQLSTGASPQEWEFAAGQIGQTPSIQYASGSGGSELTPYLAPSNPPRPTNKDTSFSIDASGVVGESVTGITGNTHPVFLLDHGFMSDDKSLVVGVGLRPDSQAPPGWSGDGRYALRIYHVTNVNSSSVTVDTRTGVQADLAGTWSFRKLTSGASPLTASGTLSIDASGGTTYVSYTDSTGDTSLPPGLSITMLPDSLNLPGVTQFWGTLADGADPSFHGKLSYAKDVLVMTRTAPSGASSLSIALR